jgi:integrase
MGQDKAVELYLAQKDYLHNGLPLPEAKPAGITVANAIGSFKAAKESAFELGELTERSLKDYKSVCQIISKTLGKDTLLSNIKPTDLVRLKAKVVKRKKGTNPTSPISMKRKLTCTRSVFLHANEELGAAVKYRTPLSSPSAKTLRKHKHETGEQLFTAEEIRLLLAKASDQMKAMIWLGITCGFGNRDVATLRVEQIDLRNGWHNYWRPKTQNPRRAPLVPECAAALYNVIKNRKSGYVFTTKYGSPWFKDGKSGVCPISAEFRKLAKRVCVYRPGVTTFYTLRRTCQTIGDAAGEPQALKFLMGHVAPTSDMSATYRQKQWTTPLLLLSEHLRGWVLGTVTVH